MNGLNQYTGSSFAYDARGNLTKDGGDTLAYDVDNHLLTGATPTSTTLGYDPLGRLWSQAVGGAATRLLSDGGELSTSYTTAGAITYRTCRAGWGRTRRWPGSMARG